MEPLTIQNTVTIYAAPARIWTVLTNGEQTKKYMFGCETVSDWQPGSPLQWRMQHEGKDLVAVTGNVVEIQPEHYLSYTVFDPNGTIPDLPENYLTVTYQLTANVDNTTLTVTQGDYNKVAEGERRYREAWNNGEGWSPILNQIKAIAEEA